MRTRIRHGLLAAVLAAAAPSGAGARDAAGAARPGSSDEVMFLEVAPEIVPCGRPSMPDLTCLRVRTIDYDQAGGKRGYGDWQVLHGSIRGYTHTVGVRNVLRVRRHAVSEPGVGTVRHRYELDMTVEAEHVPDQR